MTISVRPGPSSPSTFGGSSFDYSHHADPWAKNPIDLPTLNARASDAIIKAINQTKEAAREERRELRSASLLLLGSAGAGKTHLFTRLRRRLGPRAVFVHLRPLVGSEMTPRYVLGEIVKQLGKESSTPDGVPFRQLDALVGASLAHLRDEPPDMPRVFLDSCAEMTEAKREELLEWSLEQLLDRHSDIDETYLARLMRAPFMKPPMQRAALAWLSGRELEESQVSRLGVPGSLPEERIISALQTLGLFAAPGAPIVLVFDQLENLMDPEGTGSRVRAYANLVAELFDTMKGFIIVQMALDTEWQSAIEPALSQAQKTRLAAQTELIALPRPEEARELLRLWADQIIDRPEPFPWPFGERRVQRWCDTPGMTPRMLMIACRQALSEGPGDDKQEEVPPTQIAAQAPETETESGRPWLQEIEARHEALVAAWQQHVEQARKTLDEAGADRRSADPARVIGGIASAVRLLPNVRMGRIDARAPVQVDVDPNVSVAVLHQSHPRSLTAALEKASAVMSGPKRRALLLMRERAQELAPTWKQSLALQSALIKQGARWLPVEREDMSKLLALESFLSAARSRDLEDTQGSAIQERDVIEWVGQELAIASWPPVQSIVEASLGAAPAPAESFPSVEPTPPKSTRTKKTPAKPATTATAATIRACLSSLRVASLERLVREVNRIHPATPRSDVVAVLETMKDAVAWFGHSILAFTPQHGRAQHPTEGEPTDP